MKMLLSNGQTASGGDGAVSPLRLPARAIRPLKAEQASLRLAAQRMAVARLCLKSPQDILHERYAAEIAPLVRNATVRRAAPAAEELSLLDEILAGIAQEPPGLHWMQYRLAAMLYFLPHELPPLWDLRWAPEWLRDDFTLFTLQTPLFFHEIGEAERYRRFLEQWTGYLHASILAEPASPRWRQVALRFLEHANFIPVYFNDAKLKDLFCRRADIMEHAVGRAGFALEHSFAPRPAGAKIRLGILATSYSPSAETYASLPYFEHLPEDFEIVLYCVAARGHPMEAYCRSRAKELKVLPGNLAAQASLIRGDDLDVLLFATNVSAVTNTASLLALHRLARVQATSIFSIVSTGMRNMDCYISGKWTDPHPDATSHYREKLVLLDGSIHCFSYAGDRAGPGVQSTRDDLGIPGDAVVFASGANYFKMIPELLHAWARIIAELPDSGLLLFPYGPNWSGSYPKGPFEAHIRDVFAQYAVSPHRVKILSPDPAPDRWGMKEWYKLADVYLDSFPFCGSSSLMEPLEVGLPIIVMQGTQLRGAMAAAIMRELALTDLIAQNQAEYIRLAVELGRDPERRRAKARRVRQAIQAGPRFLNSRNFAARIAPVLRQLVSEHVLIQRENTG